MHSVKRYADTVKVIGARRRRQTLRQYGANIGATLLGAFALYAASMKHRNR